MLIFLPLRVYNFFLTKYLKNWPILTFEKNNTIFSNDSSNS